MSRPAKAIDTNSAKMSKEEREKRKIVESKLKGSNDKIKPLKYLNNRQKQVFKYLLDNLNGEILSNLDLYLLNHTAVTIERLESIEEQINKIMSDPYFKIDAISDLKPLRDTYSKDFFRCCNELSLSPQARAKISIATPPPTKKTLMDILGDDE